MSRLTIVEVTKKPEVVNSNNNIHVALVFGGMSAEREVSLMSKPMLESGLLELGYMVTPIDMGKDIADHLAKLNPDVVYNGLYGTYGEDGCLPGLLKILGLKYTLSDTTSSAIGMNKYYADNIFKANGIKCPSSLLFKEGDKLPKNPIHKPYVIKPVSEGSSVGVELIFPEDDYDFSEYKFPNGDILVQPYLKGKEIQVAVLGEKAIGAIELVSKKNRFYDYTAKYTDGYMEHIMPANITNSQYQRVLSIALKAHKVLGCKSLSRSDFIFVPEEGEDGEFYMLELNTHPGMTRLSLVPEICAHVGISYVEILEKIVKDALNSSH